MHQLHRLSHPQHAPASLTTSSQTREHVNCVEPSKLHASRSNFANSSMVTQSTCQQANLPLNATHSHFPISIAYNCIDDAGMVVVANFLKRNKGLVFFS